jgi:hypothetical protein
MRKKDLALIVLVVVISAIVSLVLSKTLFSASLQEQSAEVVQPISSTFSQPDDRYFNKKAFDPTREISISQNKNPDPFRGTAQ